MSLFTILTLFLLLGRNASCSQSSEGSTDDGTHVKDPNVTKRKTISIRNPNIHNGSNIIPNHSWRKTSLKLKVPKSGNGNSVVVEEQNTAKSASSNVNKIRLSIRKFDTSNKANTSNIPRQNLEKKRVLVKVNKSTNSLHKD